MVLLTCALPGLVGMAPSAAAAPIEGVDLADPVFRAAVNTTLDPSRTADAPVTEAEARSLTSLDISVIDDAGQIRSIEGLQYFTNLKTLSLAGADVVDIRRLRSLTGMRHLDLSFTKVADLRSLKSMTALRTLTADYADLATLRGLRHLTGLERLSTRRNVITSLKPLRGLKHLAVIDVEDNQIAGVKPLRKAPGLEVVRVRGNRIASLKALSRLPRLEQVSARNQKVELPAVQRNIAVKNPVRTIDGSWVRLTPHSKNNRSLHYSAENGTFQYSRTGQKQARWNTMVTIGAGSGSFTFRFSGTLSVRVTR